MSTDRIEQIKLTATYMNGLAIAFFAFGVLAPMFSVFYASSQRTNGANLVIGVAVCFLASIALHLLGRRTLRGLKS